MPKTILVVDDAKTIRDLAKFTLGKAGYSLLEAEDGAIAWAIVQKEKIDLIVTDLNMPNMNGLEFSEKVKTSDAYKHIPIFMLTTEASQEVAMKGKQIGILAWIVKPFVPEKFLAAVNKVIGQ